MKEKHYSSTEIFIFTDIEATGLAMTTPAGAARQLRAKKGLRRIHTICAQLCCSSKPRCMLYAI